ncbi:hypothetical protein [Aeromonas dhakensis]|uniref:hypothetical protein n=1 Tax=Aeromonas dhakensis TaxID=196024 RepID=UPI00111A6141|nr:hypothetical protein [Aeromonas dhakensis]TNI47137.1 hypothetical protein CF130_05030 [Aeromonas dhakensis]
MKPTLPTLRPLQHKSCLLARHLTALQLLCHSRSYAERLPDLVVSLCPLACQVDELEVMSAGTPLNEPIEQANRYLCALLALLATTPNGLTSVELAPMLVPAIRLLTEAEQLAWEVVA